MGSPRRPARPGFLQRRREVQLRRLDGRSQAEDQARHQRQRQREAQHAPVQVCVEWKLSRPLASSQVMERIPQSATSTPRISAGQGQQRALGQQLAHHAHASRAQTEAHRHLAPPCRGTRQQKIGDIGAREMQNQADHRHEYVERLRIPPPQRVKAARAFLQP